MHKYEPDIDWHKAIVKRVLNGNTIEANVDLGFGVKINEQLKLRSIDDAQYALIEHDSSEQAIEQFLKDTLEGKEVSLKYVRDTHGFLTLIYVNGESIHDKLIKGGFTPYKIGGESQ